MPAITDRAAVSRKERLQLIALATLARKHTQALRDLRVAAIEITEEQDEYGCTCDAIHGENDPINEIDEALAKLGLTVVEE